MSSISDIIEHYLKRILKESSTGVIEIKRSELADTFQCVPSQINYVIQTRFTIEKGYLVESKRGGGGYIRIRKVHFQTDQEVFEDLLDKVGNAIPQLTAEHIISRLVDEELMTQREALMMMRLVSRDTIQLPIPLRDQMRARMIRIMITILLTSKGE
ncbi:CtsR family transcriptional regulator [Hazenella coriacea]|uniref:Transcriptional regulator CtsR n=1 Tax=Hazenella coriacea TaxID=1179467 RepID=A0A4R3L5E5_9BACL|nr:CtsR family transcriptional regulator [Hazenella coriacea]TCS94238.1 transcriptional regulator CtsR [Hazenella coriacea]